MGFRITTNMMKSNYLYNLNSVNTKTNKAREKVMTQRNFNSYAEDPAAATQAFRLRRSYWQTSTHLANTTDTYQRFNAAWSSLGTLVTDLSDKTARASAVLGITGTAGEGRNALGQVMEETAKSMVHTMNMKYGDQFVFAGADALDVPLSWDEATGNLLYRGVNVAAGGVKEPTSTAPAWGTLDANGIPENLPESTDQLTDDELEWYNYYKDRSDLVKLEAMAKETQYVDLGMGMQEAASATLQNGQVINGSAFDASLPAISVLGYGVDDEGDPKNIILLTKQLGEIFSRATASGFDSPEDEATANRLLNKLNASHEELTRQYTDMDTKAQFLQTAEGRLTDQQAALNEQILSVEQIDMADAITEFSWQQYCYNAALKIGNQLLSESLIDYMR